MSASYCKMPLDKIASPQRLFTQFYCKDFNCIYFFLKIVFFGTWLTFNLPCIFDRYLASVPATFLPAVYSLSCGSLGETQLAPEHLQLACHTPSEFQALGFSVPSPRTQAHLQLLDTLFFLPCLWYNCLCLAANKDDAFGAKMMLLVAESALPR